MRTTISRDNPNGTGALTGGQVTKGDQHSPANSCSFGTTFASSQGTIVAGAIWGTSWNAHGGVIRWLADPTYILSIYDSLGGNSEIECRAVVGTASSSYEIMWLEL
jgi:hypothetical protein